MTLAKITKATFGKGGYDDACIGLSLTFEGGGTGCGDFIGTWATRPASAQWSEADQSMKFAEAVRKLRDTLRDAKKDHVAQLVGTPVDLTIEGGRLVSWRVLMEVL